MNDPAIIAALISVVAVVTLALATLVYRFGKLTAQVGNLRREATRRHDDYLLQSKERYEGITSRLTRLENHFLSGAVGGDDD